MLRSAFLAPNIGDLVCDLERSSILFEFVGVLDWIDSGFEMLVVC